MSKTWYTVINYDLCIECGTCTDKCKHVVYDKNQEPLPVVIYPDGCVQGCHGCENLCPSDAIEYAGYKGKSSNNACKCG